MAFEIERNRRLYREADDGLPALPGASRRCVATARVLYARILERIEEADYDVFASRARVPTPAKAALAARMVVSREPMRLVRADRAARDPLDGAWVSDDPVVLLDDAGSPGGAGAEVGRSTTTTPRCTSRSPATSSTPPGGSSSRRAPRASRASRAS